MGWELVRVEVGTSCHRWGGGEGGEGASCHASIVWFTWRQYISALPLLTSNI